MTPFEAFLAFMVVMGVIAIPLSAIITRPRSPIGEAIADRIRRKTERRLGQRPAESEATQHSIETRATPGARALEDQDQQLGNIETRLEFLERLLEREETRGSDRKD